MSVEWIAAYIITNIVMLVIVSDLFKRMLSDKSITPHLLGLAATCSTLLWLATA